MDPSEKAVIEVLVPKSVPEGLVAWATVLHVSDSLLKLQITGGAICLVNRLSISKSFTASLEEYQNNPDNLKGPPRLPQLFKKGQQYVCKVTERRLRKGYTDSYDIIATLEPQAIQEDVLPKTLLSIPQVPLQCAVQSIEDHGYQMDIGITGITGFLAFEDAEEYCELHNETNKFHRGQIVRCCLKQAMSFETGQRVAHLSLKRADLKKSQFSQEKVAGYILNDRCILPGSKSFLTVMKVAGEGLVVNFMNEFAGFVSKDHLKEEWHTPRDNYKISDQIKCTVLYYNQLTKTFGLTLKKMSSYRKTLKHFMDNYYIGKIIKNATVIKLNGTKAVVFKVDKAYKAVANSKNALEEDISIMSKDELSLALDSTFPDGSKHRCRILSVNLADLILVVSLKEKFMNQTFLSIEELQPGQFVSATVKKHVKDGVIVNFGQNLRSIILNNDLHDYTSPETYKRYPVGKTIKCRVLKVDTSKHSPRVYLTNKEQLMKKDLVIIDSFCSSFKGKLTEANVIKVSPKGLIVELFNNMKGFIPKIFLSSTALKNVENSFKVGQVISCVVYKVDEARRSLTLGVIPYEEIMSLKKEKEKLKKNKTKIKSLEKEFKTKIPKDIDLKELESTVPSKKSQEKPLAERQDLLVEQKTRRERSEEARLKEEKLREEENRSLDPNRQPQSILDFERLLLKTPNCADIWIKYSKYFLDNVETEKARIVCRRAIKTINFRLEKEKLKVWLHLIKIEAKFGGAQQMRETLEEAAQTNDRTSLYQGTVKVLVSCHELDEAERVLELMLKNNHRSVDVWIEVLGFYMEHRKDFTKARASFDKAAKILSDLDKITLKSKFAQLEFKFGDVERGKTTFESLLSDNPKRTDLWRIYESMLKKFGTRQVDTPESRHLNDQILQRVAESIELVSKKSRKRHKP